MNTLIVSMEYIDLRNNWLYQRVKTTAVFSVYVRGNNGGGSNY
jgi:hypothetical protein